MNRWNDTAERRARYESRDGLDRWAARARLYLKSRTADHWLMFIAGLLIGALIA